MPHRRRDNEYIHELSPVAKCSIAAFILAFASLVGYFWYTKEYLPSQDKKAREAEESKGPERFINSERGASRGF
jgi:hypothetical protein